MCCFIVSQNQEERYTEKKAVSCVFLAWVCTFVTCKLTTVQSGFILLSTHVYKNGIQQRKYPNIFVQYFT